jgi:hypothetical protein
MSLVYERPWRSEADCAILFHSCTGEQRGRHSDAEGLRGLEIDNQLEFGRLHNRQVGGLAPLRIFSAYSPICRIAITRKKPSPAPRLLVFAATKARLCKTRLETLPNESIIRT